MTCASTEQASGSISIAAEAAKEPRQMPLRRAYAPVMPELDPFLFASVGEEIDGAPLSVLSALTRLGIDPRDEAARLSRMSREAAADRLGRMIARSSEGRWTAAEARRIARGLAEHLPAATVSGGAHRVQGGAARVAGVPVLLIYLVIAGAALVSLISLFVRGILVF